MKREKIEKKVNEVLNDVLGISYSEIKDDAVLEANFGADSFDAVEIVMGLEHKFGISIPDEKMYDNESCTVKDVYDLVEDLLCMKEIKISQKDYDFLKDLQHELQTQDNDGTADPLYWMVEEEETVGVPDGCGDPIIYMGDGATMELEEAVKYIEEDYLKDLDEDGKEEWANVDKDYMEDVVRFMNDVLDRHEVRIVWLKKQEVISRETGAFITKRACKEYIQKFGYNHTNPHTYAMCAYRNFELARLLKIIKTMEL